MPFPPPNQQRQSTEGKISADTEAIYDSAQYLHELYTSTRCTHTRTRLTALCLGLPRWAGTRKVKPIWILLEQETVSGSGISWAICKSTYRSRQITTPAPHHSVFYRPDALPVAQPTVSKHWRRTSTRCNRALRQYDVNNFTKFNGWQCKNISKIIQNNTQIVCIWYSWYHCHLLTQMVLETRLLDEDASLFSMTIFCMLHIKHKRCQCTNYVLAHLFLNVLLWRTEKSNKYRNGPKFNDYTRLSWSARCYICQRPCSFKLQHITHQQVYRLSEWLKGRPNSITERRVPELIPVPGSQPGGDVSHKPGSRLPLLSARPDVTPAILKRAATNFAAWWTEAQ